MTPTVRKIAIAAVVVIVSVAGYVTYARWSRSQSMPDGLLLANGRIEGDTVSVASKYPGRIQSLLVREGDSVTTKQKIAVLDSTEVATKVAQAESAMAAVQAQLTAARTSITILQKQVPLNINAAEADLGRAQAARAKAGAASEQAQRDATRFKNLADKGSVPRQRAELASLSAIAAANDEAAADKMVIEATQKLVDAKLGYEQIKAKQQQMQALEAQSRQASAASDEPKSVVADMTLTAPIAGVVTTRVRDMGEVVAAGSPIVNLVNLDRLYLKVYIPESEIGKVRLGLKSQVWTDAYPDQPFNAVVRYISSQAEFTPKEVQTADERVKLTYAVHLYFEDNSSRRLTPGLPADAVIRWKNGVDWVKPKW